MKGLLSLQARVLLRWSTGRTEGVVFLPLIAAAILLTGFSTEDSGSLRFVVLLLTCMALVLAMLRTLDALDAATASRPLRRGTVLEAHVFFWTGAWLLAGAGLALLSGGLRDADGPLFRAMAVFGAAATGWALVVHEAGRRGTTGTWVVAGLLLLWALPSITLPVLIESVIRDTGGGAGPDLDLIGLPAAAVNLAVGGFLFLRSREGRPSLVDTGVGGTVPVPARPSVQGGGTVAAGRAPIHTILRGSLLSLRVVPWLLLGFLCPLFPGKADWDAFLLVFGVLCASNVAIGCLVAWRWLTAAPLSRTRAFGILFAPFLAMLVLGPSIRAAVVEVQDRTVLYEKHWFSYADGRGRFPVQFVPVDRSRQAEEDVLGGSPETLVSRTGDHLAARFGIAGSARVREAILRGWPGGGGVPTKDDVNTEVPAALDRVRAAFLPELRTVLHRRMLADAMAALVLGSLLLILQTTLRPPWKTTAWFVAVLPLVMMTVPNLGLGGFAPALAVRDAYYGAFTASPIPCSLAALASSALLLGVALGGFRRMEYDDLPPATAGRKM